jgi:hypothetical protein
MSLINESLAEIVSRYAPVFQKPHTVASGSLGIRQQRTVPESDFRTRTGPSRTKAIPKILKQPRMNQPGCLLWFRNASEDEIVIVFD